MSQISRSEYQKVVEENKRLLLDIKILTQEGIPSAQKILCIAKWRQKQKYTEAMSSALKAAAEEYIKIHKNELPDFLSNPKEFPEV